MGRVGTKLGQKVGRDPAELMSTVTSLPRNTAETIQGLLLRIAQRLDEDPDDVDGEVWQIGYQLYEFCWPLISDSTKEGANRRKAVIDLIWSLAFSRTDELDRLRCRLPLDKDEVFSWLSRFKEEDQIAPELHPVVG